MRQKIPNYLKKLNKLVEKNPDQFSGGKLLINHIYHDDWCKALKGGICNCDPDLEIIDITHHDGH